MLYPSKVIGPTMDINLHDITSIIVLIDNTISAYPVRILHVIYPFIFGFTYATFTLIYYAVDPKHDAPYPGLIDWNQPGISIGIFVAFGLGLLPVIQLFWYGFYRFKLWIVWKISSPVRRSTVIEELL